MDRARALDAADPLAAARDRFRLPDDLIYLDGNSLGPLPVGVPERVRLLVESEWGEGLIRSWNEAGWIDLPRRVGDRIAELVGAEPGTVVACDSTSVNLYKAASAALRISDRPVILTDSGNFPTDRYVLGSVADAGGGRVRTVDPEDVLDAIENSVGVVALTQVDYRTGRRHDMEEVGGAARAVGAVTVWDLAHSAGAFSVDLTASGADLAVGCGYKYLNGGPGAPSFIYVAPHRQAAFRNPMTGWFGHAAPFAFEDEFRPASGIDRARVGTSHILSLAALDAALDVFDGLDMVELQDKGSSLTGLFLEMVDDVGGFDVLTPRNPRWRGSQVSIRHPQAYAIVQALIASGVIGDYREPNVARFGFGPLFLRHVDVVEAVGVLQRVMEEREWADPRFSVRRRVT